MDGRWVPEVTRWWVAVVTVVVGVLGGTLLFWHGMTVREYRPATRTWAVPEPGECFDLPPVGARPWPAWSTGLVDCTEPHTLEVAFVGSAPAELLRPARQARDAVSGPARDLLTSFARSTCGGAATGYLGGNWHLAQIEVLADWIYPSYSDTFICALAQVPGPGLQRWLTRRWSLAGALATPENPLLIGCVTRIQAELYYTPCDEAHDGEFVGLQPYRPMGAAFDETVIRRAAANGCRMLLARYLGLPPGLRRGDLYVGYTGPTRKETWWGSDQIFACFALANIGVQPLRGSLWKLGTRPLPI